MKPGYRTSEFYVALTGIGGLVWTFLQTHCQTNPMELFALAGVVMTYIAGRSYVKANA